MQPLFFFKQAVSDIRANKLLHALAISTIALIFLLAGSFALVFVNLTQLMTSYQENIRVMVYLAPGQARQDVARIRKALEDLPRVREVRFISKAQAMQDLRESMKHQAGLLEGLAENPLPDAFEVVVSPGGQGWEALQITADQMERVPGVDEANFGQDWLERFQAVARMGRMIAVALGTLLMVAALSITANTIRLVLFNRREEIRIMELVGATNGFIRASFYIQGMLQGLLGGAAALGILAAFFFLLVTGLPTHELLGRFAFRFIPGWSCVLGLALAVAVGAAGCHLSFAQFRKD